MKGSCLGLLQVLQEDDDPDTPKAPTPKKIIVSGGLTGFGIAEDLLRIDFSTPEEAPEEYKAVAFFEEPDQIGHGISGEDMTYSNLSQTKLMVTSSQICEVCCAKAPKQA